MTFRNGLLLASSCLMGVFFGPTLTRQPYSNLSLGIGSRAFARDTSAQVSSPEETIRLLTLFGTVLDLVRAEYVEPVSEKNLINNALDGMVSGLDPHSSYMTEQQYKEMKIQISGKFGGLGVKVQEQNGYVRVVSPIDGTPAFRAGLKPGDYITEVDGKSLAGQTLDQSVNKMRGDPGTKITLTIIRPRAAKPIKVTLTREIIHVQVVRSALYGPIAYIRISEFDDDATSAMEKAFKKLKAQAHGDLKGLVLDLRLDPGGKLDQAIDVSDDFIRKGKIVSIRGRRPEDSRSWDAEGKDMTNGLPIVVLIDGGSASASEIVAGALQDHRRAILLGEKSFGKGSVQSLIPIPGNGAVRLTTARYYTPSGRSIQAKGILPDIEVRESRDSDDGYGFRESDLAHILANLDGKKPKAPPRTDLPSIATSIPKEPPKDWPQFKLETPATDFQLQQGLRVVRAMAKLPDIAFPLSNPVKKKDEQGKKPDASEKTKSQAHK